MELTFQFVSYTNTKTFKVQRGDKLKILRNTLCVKKVKIFKDIRWISFLPELHVWKIKNNKLQLKIFWYNELSDTQHLNCTFSVINRCIINMQSFRTFNAPPRPIVTFTVCHRTYETCFCINWIRYRSGYGSTEIYGT